MRHASDAHRAKTCSGLHPTSTLNPERLGAYDRFMLPYLLLVTLIGGLLMYLLGKSTKTARIGEMLFFASVLALLIALAPSTVAKLHG